MVYLIINKKIMNSKNQESPKEKDGNEIPKNEKQIEEIPYQPDELEVVQPRTDADLSYSEEHDVTPPDPHGPPSFIDAETDFVSQGRHGRKTGTMIDHEPGI